MVGWNEQLFSYAGVGVISWPMVAHVIEVSTPVPLISDLGLGPDNCVYCFIICNLAFDCSALTVLKTTNQRNFNTLFKS